MAFSLNYSLVESAIVAGPCACLMLLLLILIHPLRCVVTVTVPSLGTKQGRKILLSTALLISVTSCVPNMSRNISLTLDTFKCAAGNVTESALQSGKTLSQSLHDVKDFLNSIPSIVETSNNLDIQDNANIEGMKKRLSETSNKMKAEVNSLHQSISVVSHVLKKVIAGIFVFLMIGNSASYLIGYLTDVKHDNVYLSRRLQEALRRSGDATVPESYRKKLVKTSGIRVTSRELTRGLWGTLVLLFYGSLCAMMMYMDHFIFSTLQGLLAWSSDIPEIHGFLNTEMTMTTTVIGIIPGGVHKLTKQYSYTVPLLPKGCVHKLSSPNSSTLTSVCVLLVIALLMLMGEMFARRLRRKVCASFYHTREEERTRHILQKILEKRETGGE
ncbi:osteoclast stimulatory transmembrane protein-like [Chanos chanos]|uniref:Osteoclast stimulatory transmembrane protein-like n=1 Tax=Chanos chanos TaxID=29144 RepID=A0A6J2V8R2_CHACN|nr:osteoclast stimulatory transmembrane protein-like [Chanos chanos]